MLRATFFIVWLCTIASSCLSADLITLGDEMMYDLRIVGEIQVGDFDRIAAHVIDESGACCALVLDSPGGDVLEAIKIGELIRDNLMNTDVDMFRQCNSACFLIWAAGVIRSASGANSFGMHRPIYDRAYFSTLSAEEAEKEYRKLDALVRSYLFRMNVPVELVDEMFRTSFDSPVNYSGDEMVSRVGKTAPAFEEWLEAKCGSLLSPDERADWEQLQVAKKCSGKIGEYTSIISPELHREICGRLKEYSVGYVTYVESRARAYSSCAAESILDARLTYIRRLQNR
ncbi:MAG: hypothetical protein RIC85_01530 [Gammaproteobacteria bacterium]